MSDADDQIGGTGGERGQEPGQANAQPQPENVDNDPKPERGGADVDRDSEASFPASDPPATF